jgi:predicted transposase/invertase (TIGR01784 family)
MTGLLNPSSDFVFKNLFGADKHKRVLLCLLNAILKGKPLIKSITLLNPEHKKERKDGRSVTLDIEAVTDNGTLLNIEVQCVRDGNLVNRALHHQARIMRNELNEGETFDSQPDIISIWLTDYNETVRKHHTHEAVYMFKATPLDGVDIASEKTRIFIIELPKVDLKQASLNDMFLVWMFFLKNPELLPEEFVTKVPEVHEALEELKIMSMDDEFRAEYDAHIKAQNDRRSREANAKEEGREEGIAIGEERGIAIGEERGELKKAKETAGNLLSMGLSVEQIAKATGLSIEEIRRMSSQK